MILLYVVKYCKWKEKQKKIFRFYETLILWANMIASQLITSENKSSACMHGNFSFTLFLLLSGKKSIDRWKLSRQMSLRKFVFLASVRAWTLFELTVGFSYGWPESLDNSKAKKITERKRSWNKRKEINKAQIDYTRRKSKSNYWPEAHCFVFCKWIFPSIFYSWMRRFSLTFSFPGWFSLCARFSRALWKVCLSTEWKTCCDSHDSPLASWCSLVPEN